jgi:Ethanolamine utilization protein EutJ (predicted chaperonin)
VLYDRDQAFGGAQLTQLIVRQYGFSAEEAETKKRNGDLPEDYENGVLKPFVESMVQEDRAVRCSSSLPARPTTRSTTSCWQVAPPHCRA